MFQMRKRDSKETSVGRRKINECKLVAIGYLSPTPCRHCQQSTFQNRSIKLFYRDLLPNGGWKMSARLKAKQGTVRSWLTPRLCQNGHTQQTHPLTCCSWEHQPRARYCVVFKLCYFQRSRQLSEVETRGPTYRLGNSGSSCFLKLGNCKNYKTRLEYFTGAHGLMRGWRN